MKSRKCRVGEMFNEAGEILALLKVINADKVTSYICDNDKPSKSTNIVLFDYHSSRAGQYTVYFLELYQGYIHIDDYKTYEKTLVAYLAYVRRKFIEAQDNNKKTGKADTALNSIGNPYSIKQCDQRKAQH